MIKMMGVLCSTRSPTAVQGVESTIKWKAGMRLQQANNGEDQRRTMLATILRAIVMDYS
jgi:hypothetical protein